MIKALYLGLEEVELSHAAYKLAKYGEARSVIYAQMIASRLWMTEVTSRYHRFLP